MTNPERWRSSLVAAVLVALVAVLVPAGTAAAQVPADGNVAPRATTKTASAGNPAPGGLVDGSGVAGTRGVGVDWTATRPAGARVDLAWSTPQELTSIALVGSPRSSATLVSATIRFSDGSTLPLGGVDSDPARPTIVAFPPRNTTSVRLTVDAVAGPGALSLGELRTYRKGFLPARAATGPSPTGFTGPPPAAACPARTVAPALTVRCPAGDSLVGTSTSVTVDVAAGYTRVAAVVWPGETSRPEGPSVTLAVSSGSATVPLDLSGVPAGPITVRLTATGPGIADRTVLLPLVRSGGVPASERIPSGPLAAGRTLVYRDEFASPVSLSRNGTGADYAAGKPVIGGAEDFGDAPFANPAAGLGNVGATSGLLRLGLQLGDGRGGYPAGRLVGSMAASARAGGSGFSAQYGYFESRMFVPWAEGTWPAFWMLPSENLVRPLPAVAEIDAVELYGRFPRGSCHSTHDFQDGKDLGVGNCAENRFGRERRVIGWHTYGVAITPTGNTFTIDGREVARSPQVTGGSSPMFFLLNLAAGGGWPVDLKPLQSRAAVYVDYVRVYV